MGCLDGKDESGSPSLVCVGSWLGCIVVVGEVVLGKVVGVVYYSGATLAVSFCGVGCWDASPSWDHDDDEGKACSFFSPRWLAS